MSITGKNEIDELLAKSFKELAKRKPVEKITIKEITDGAGGIRPTFYNHFHDKYELLDWIIRVELLMPVWDEVRKGREREGIVAMMDRLEEDQTFYLNVVDMEGQNAFEELLKEALSDAFQQFISEQRLQRKAPFDWLTPKVVADAYAAFMGYILIQWIKNYRNIPKEGLVETMMFMLRHSTAEMLFTRGLDVDRQDIF